MVTKVSTKDMPRSEWLERRRLTIGGSDAGALMGLNKFKPPYSLWAEKTGKLVPEDISDQEAVRLGNDLEQYVADRFTEATGKKLRRENNFLYNSEYPFAHANIDRAVSGEPDAGFEAKTTSSFEILHQCQAGQYPDAWYCQVTHYMMVTGAKRWYLGVLALGHGFFWFTIERDEAEIAALAQIEADFYESVRTNTPPAIDGSASTEEAIKAIYQESEAETVCDLGGVADHVKLYILLDKRIKEMEADRQEHQSAIMSYMESAESGVTDNVKITWKSQHRKTFDRKKFEAEHGSIPEEYFKESVSRPFKLKITE